MNQSRFDTYINSHPRQSLQLFLLALCFGWQSMVCLLTIALYFFLVKVLRIQVWIVVLFGVLITTFTITTELFRIGVGNFFYNGFLINIEFWRKLFSYNLLYALKFVVRIGDTYVFGLPLLFAGVFSLTDFIDKKPYQKLMESLQKGKIYQDKIELSDNVIETKLSNIDDDTHDGIVLGVSKYSGHPVVIPDYYVNQVLLVLGTTGSGKTITLRRFYKRAIKKGYPLVIVDGKPDESNVAWVEQLAKKSNRRFYGFNCGNFDTYNPLAHGGFTELKDKIISLKDEWENDYYRSIAEDYLQTVFETLIEAREQFDLKRVIEYLDYDEILLLARKTENQELLKRVVKLEAYDRKDITGLQAHLNLLIHSELGQFFLINENTFSLKKIIDEKAVVYFALPALRYPSFSKVLGKLVINDLKATIDDVNNKKVFMIFDEFSVFAGDQVLNLVNMGRGKGVHAVFGTQGLADLNRVNVDFKNQILNCVNTIICHRLNDQSSAEEISHWAGTNDSLNVTAQIGGDRGNNVGSVRADKKFIIHPEQIKKDLSTGEAFFVSKIDNFLWAKIKVALY